MELVEKGNVDAIYELAIRKHYGYGMKKDYNEYFNLFKNAAEKGNINALYMKAYCYYNGLGTEQNYEKALEIFNNLIEKHNDKNSKYMILNLK